jgi:hypothetical protein
MWSNAERTAAEWFAEALRWYLEGHQGCPCCHRRHCVFRSEWGCRIEFHCTECDFSASWDGLTDTASSTPGTLRDDPRPPALLDAEELFDLRFPPGLATS